MPKTVSIAVRAEEVERNLYHRESLAEESELRGQAVARISIKAGAAHVAMTSQQETAAFEVMLCHQSD